MLTNTIYIHVNKNYAKLQLMTNGKERNKSSKKRQLIRLVKMNMVLPPRK